MWELDRSGFVGKGRYLVLDVSLSVLLLAQRALMVYEKLDIVAIQASHFPHMHI